MDIIMNIEVALRSYKCWNDPALGAIVRSVPPKQDEPAVLCSRDRGFLSFREGGRGAHSKTLPAPRPHPP